MSACASAPAGPWCATPLPVARGWCRREQRDPWGPLRCECACDPLPCRCRAERGGCALNAKHRGAAGVVAEFTRFDDGGVALRLCYPTGVAHGDTHAEALASGLWMARGALANARRLREMHAEAPCTCGARPHRWGCERVWTEQGLTAREALRGDGR